MTSISVALPVYNGADYLREALDSVLAQDFADFELVVSDNCSTDETSAILAEYAARDARVRVSRAPAFLSQSANINRVVELCSGEWVKLFCHDDLMTKGCLKAIHRAVTERDAASVGLIGNSEAWLFANGYLHDPHSTASRGAVHAARSEFYRGPEYISGMLKGQPSWGVPSVTTATVKKRAWMECRDFDGFYSQGDVFGDTILWTHLLMKWDYLHVPEVLTINRIHGRQVAAAARKNCRMIEHSRLFYKGFLRRWEDKLNFSSRDKLKLKARFLAVAGSYVATKLIKHNFKAALSLVASMPRYWLPLLPVFVARSYLKEKKKIAPLTEQVPVSLLYPE
jgi:glycosyltransferase involved in cell wall biosynthesis